jgi:hypothetical protein
VHGPVALLHVRVVPSKHVAEAVQDIRRGNGTISPGIGAGTEALQSADVGVVAARAIGAASLAALSAASARPGRRRAATRTRAVERDIVVSFSSA